METLGLQDVAQQLDQEQAHRALRLAVKLSDMGYKDIAERCGLSLASVGAKVKGTVAFQERDYLLFSVALDVPMDLFNWGPAEILRWYAEHRTELFRCLVA